MAHVEFIQFAPVPPIRLGAGEVDGDESMRLGPAAVAQGPEFFRGQIRAVFAVDEVEGPGVLPEEADEVSILPDGLPRKLEVVLER